MVKQRKAGRKLTSDGCSDETRKRIHRWFNAPKDQRQPPTQELFAEQLGIHRNTLKSWSQQSVGRYPDRYWGSPLERFNEEIDQRFPELRRLKKQEPVAPAIVIGTTTSAPLTTPRPDPPVAREVLEGHGWNCECHGCLLNIKIQAIIRDAQNAPG